MSLIQSTKKGLASLSLASTGLFVSASTAFAAADLPKLDDFGTQFGDKSLSETIQSLLGVFMGLLGLIALFLFLFGGFKWLTAAGSEEKIKEAKKFMFQGVIGMLIILASYALAGFVVGALGEATGTTIE